MSFPERMTRMPRVDKKTAQQGAQDSSKPCVAGEAIVKGLRGLGLGFGDVALVHSSLSSLGHVPGGAETVIDALLETVGPRGTIVVPTLTGSAELKPSRPPSIDLLETPCWTGIIPETFRKRPGAIRSIHPTHSVAAIGPVAEWLCAAHEISPTPCGATSPYWRLAQAGGYVVFIGCTLASCTMLHCAEELAAVPYVVQKRVTVGLVRLFGRELEVPCRLHDYNAPERRFERMEKVLAERGILRTGKIGPATVRVVKAMPMLATAFEYIRRDPWFLTVKGTVAT